MPAPRCFSLPAEPASRMRRAGRHSPRAAMMVSISIFVDADHGLTEILGKTCEQLGVLPIGGGLHDGGCALGRVSGLEDAGTDEHAFGTQLAS